MKRIIRLTESDLVKLVKRVINEQGLSDIGTNTIIGVMKHCGENKLFLKVKQGTATNLETGQKLTTASPPFKPRDTSKNFLQVDNGGLVMFRNGFEQYEVGPGTYNCMTLASAKRIQDLQKPTATPKPKREMDFDLVQGLHYKPQGQPGTSTR